jgi:drug/metabolite transporter (DMT)-like permease
VGGILDLKKRYGMIMGIFACFLWSTAFAVVKIGFKYVPAPLTFAGMRFTLAGILLIPFCWRRNILTLLATHRKVITYVALLNVGIGYAFYYIAMKYVSGATAAIVIGTGPLITAVMSHFILDNDRMDRMKFFSILLGIGGVSIIMFNTKPITPLGRKEFMGILLLLVNSTLSSYANIKVAQIKGGIDGRFLTSNQMLWGGSMLLIMGNIFEKGYEVNLSNLPFKFYISLLWLAFVSAAAFSLWFVAIQMEEIKVSELNMLKFIIPVLGAVISWTMLPEESPNASSLIGMFLVFSSLVVYNINNKNH